MSAVESDADRYTVPGLERGLRILGEFSRREPELTAPELARRLGVPRSTVFRLLVTLENLGFVERTRDGRSYRLGLAILRLGFDYLASQDMVELGRPLLEALRDDTGFAASLVVRDGRDVVYLHRAPSRSPFSTTVSVGTRLPAHATVLGHVLLGDLSLATLKGLYPERRLEARSPNTPADAAALFDLAQQIRARGWVLAEGFFEAHICTVAAPVYDQAATFRVTNSRALSPVSATPPTGSPHSSTTAPNPYPIRWWYRSGGRGPDFCCIQMSALFPNHPRPERTPA